MKFSKAIVFTTLAFATTNVWAADEDSYTSYDSIVSELRASAEVEAPHIRPELNWDEVALHGGLSLAASFASFNGPYGLVGSGMLKGFEAHFGFNMFSKVVRSEFAFRNYSPETISGGTRAEMREFEGRIVFLPALQTYTKLRMGGGISDRTAILSAPRVGSFKETTPYYALLLGFEHKVADSVSIGPDVSYHSPLESNTSGRSSWDTTVHLNATF